MHDRLGSANPEFESESPIVTSHPRFSRRAAVLAPPAVVAPASAKFEARTVVGVLVGLSFLTLLAPFLFGDIPPLTDYPNHLARYWLIAGGVREPALAPFYRIDWFNAVTNVGVDRMVAVLAPLASGLVLGHVAA